jgi:hypothetical protein
MFSSHFLHGLVIDIDAFCSDTSTLLFSPQEIISAASAASAARHSGIPFHYEVRVLQNDSGLQPSSTMYYGIPLDLQVLRVLYVFVSAAIDSLAVSLLQNSDLESAMLRFQSERS